MNRPGQPRPHGGRRFALALGACLAAAAVSAAGRSEKAGRTRTGRLDKYEIRYYVIHSDLDIDAVREAAARMNTMAEEYHRRTRGFAGKIRKKLPFYLFSSPADYLACGGLEGSAGVFIVADGRARLMAVASSPGGRLWRAVQHEGFHQFAWFVISRRLPVWVNEGLAEYFACARWTGDGYVTGLIPPSRLRRVKAMIKAKEYLPFPEMLTMSQRQWNSRLSSRNYLQGWSMVHFLVHGEDGKYRKAFGRYITDVAGGKGPQIAFVRRFGRDTKAFGERYRRWWAALPAEPTRDLYTQAVVATLTSFLARTKAAGVKAQNIDEFLAAARAGKIIVDGKKHPGLWLPQSLLEDALRQAERLGKWSLDSSGIRPKLLLKQKDGTGFTGSYIARRGRPPKVKVEIDRPEPKPKAGPTTKAPPGKKQRPASAPGGAPSGEKPLSLCLLPAKVAWWPAAAAWPGRPAG